MTDGNAKRNDAKICGVCGDKALGYNFNAVTCESCKAFFRRNALKKKEFKCPFNDSCKVDVVTRRFCQKCRLKKCFTIGMKKEWIMTDEEKKIKKQKIEENRQKRHGDGPCPSPTLNSASSSVCSPLSDDLSKLSPPSPTSLLKLQPSTGSLRSSEAEESMEVNILTPMSEERSDYDGSSPISPPLLPASCSPAASAPAGSPCSFRSESVCSSSNSVGSDVKPTLHLLSPAPSISATSPNSVSPHSETVNIKLEFNSGSPEAALPERRLTDEEIYKLNELNIAEKAMKSPITDDDRIQPSADSSLINVINLTDIAIRRLIKMSKKISGFKNLCEGDQIALLKGGCTELMILRSVMTYNPENQCWQGPKGPKVMQIKMDVLREAKGNVYEEHKRFIQSFDRNWRADENIMLILGAITLFSPMRPHVVHHEIIQTEQKSYYDLLRNYLRSIYSECEAQLAFKKLVQRIDQLHMLNENHVRVFLDLDPKDVEPLLIEIFDLKNH